MFVVTAQNLVLMKKIGFCSQVDRESKHSFFPLLCCCHTSELSIAVVQVQFSWVKVPVTVLGSSCLAAPLPRLSSTSVGMKLPQECPILSIYGPGEITAVESIS